MKYDESKNILSIDPIINEKAGEYKMSVKLADSWGAER